MSFDDAVLSVHRDPGKVADMLVGTGELIEQRSLSAVLIARKGKGERFGIRQRMLRLSFMGLAVFAETRMFDVFIDAAGSLPDRRVRRFDLDLLRVRQAQRQLIAVQAQFHGIAHGRQFYHFQDGARGHAHIEEVLAQRALSSDFRDPTELARL